MSLFFADAGFAITTFSDADSRLLPLPFRYAFRQLMMMPLLSIFTLMMMFHCFR